MPRCRGRKREGAVREARRPCLQSLCDQLVCWIADNSQPLPGRRGERPDLGDFTRLLATGDERAAVAVQRLVGEREAQRHRGVVGLAFAPGFGEVALQELDVGHLVDDVPRTVLGEVLLEIGDHLRRRERVQLGHVLVRPGRLNLAEQALERLVIVRLDLERRVVGIGAETEAAKTTGKTATETAALIRLRSGSCARVGIGIGRLRRVTALPPGHRQPHHQHHEHDLDDQAQDRGQTAEAAEQATAEQHAEQAGAEEAGRKAAHEAAGAAEQAAARGRGSSRVHACARLGVGAVELRGRAWRRRGRGRSGIGARAARTGRAAAADARVGGRDDERCRQRKRQHDGERLEEIAGA